MVLAARLLGRYKEAAEDHAVSVMPDGKNVGERSPLPLVVGRQLGESEVEHLDRAVGLDLDIGRLKVAMRDALLVRCFQRVGNLSCDACGLVERHRPPKAIPLDVLHNKVVWADVVQRANVGMVQSGHGPRLLLEALVNRSLDILIATMRSSRVSRAL